MDINLGQREYLLEILNCEYVIPDELHDCVKDAIRKYATHSNYSESAIEAMLKKPQSLATSISSISTIRDGNLSLFRGKFAEWLACIEYNALKNKGNVVMTIINPDTTSKADLLHIIKKGDKYEAIQGPDIKCGSTSYVFSQWKKIVNSRYDIPMVDMDDVLTSEEGLKMLTKKQREEFEELQRLFPKKKPIRSEWNKQDINRLMMDYLKYISEDVTPSIPNNKAFIASKENREKIKEKLKQLPEKKIPQSNWNEFYNKSASFPGISDDYKSKMTLSKNEKSQEEKLTREKLNSSTKNKKNSSEVKGNNRKGRFSIYIDKAKRIMTDFSGRVAKFHGYDTPAEMLVDAVKSTAEILIENTTKAFVDTIFGGNSDSATSFYDMDEEVKDNNNKSEEINNKKNKSDIRSTTAHASPTEQEVKDNNNKSEEINKRIDNNDIRSTKTHASPNEHVVKEHGQNYHTKQGIVWREKKPYPRGGKDENI